MRSGTVSAIDRWGRSSWMLLGIVALAAVAYSALAVLSSLVIPLVIATVVAMLAVPAVDWLEQWRVPRAIGAALFIVVLVVVSIGSVGIAVDGIVDQSDEITSEVTAGIERIDSWLEDISLDIGGSEERVAQAKELGVDMLPGLASWFTTALSGAVSFVVGGFLAVFLLYFLLVDWVTLKSWVARHLGVPSHLGEQIVEDATVVIRRGFSALTVSSLVTAVLIGATVLLLGLPLAFTIALVTFMTSYIPYLGAIFSALFAFLVALGAGGTTEALILLVVILVVQNVVQTVVQTKLTSSQLSLHPIASLASTIVGASLAGLLGATLSAPILAMCIGIIRRVREYDESTEGTVSQTS